jgi:hypothetical protein
MEKVIGEISMELDEMLKISDDLEGYRKELAAILSRVSANDCIIFVAAIEAFRLLAYDEFQPEAPRERLK